MARTNVYMWWVPWPEVTGISWFLEYYVCLGLDKYDYFSLEELAIMEYLANTLIRFLSITMLTLQTLLYITIGVQLVGETLEADTLSILIWYSL